MTAYGNFVLDKGFDPQSLPITKFRYVKLNGSVGADSVGAKAQVVPVAAITDRPVGVAQESVVSADAVRGKGLPVRISGISEVEVDGTTAINIGDRLGTNASGQVGAVSSTNIGAIVVGRALQNGDTTAGHRVSVLILQT